MPHAPQGPSAPHRDDPHDPAALIDVSLAAALLGVTVPTLEKWVRQGRLRAHRPAAGGPHRVRRGNVLALRDRSRLPTRPVDDGTRPR